MFRALATLFIVLLGFDISVSATTHNLVVGTFSTEFLYTVEYDDEIERLTLVAQSAVAAASSWITLNHDKTKLYGTDWNAPEPTWVSYDVTDPCAIKVEARIVGGSACSGSRSIFANARQERPYAVYGNYYYGDARCGTVLSVHENGTLKEVIQEYTYGPGSAVHGTAITPDGKFLLSADTTGNLIWTHAIDQATGVLSHVAVGVVEGPSSGSGPRHIVVHENGKFAYVVLEEASEIAQYSVDKEDGTLSLVGDTYPLLRSGEDPDDYWADEVSLSRDSRYLWATNRARDDSKKGYISAFELSPTGEIASQLFLRETSTSGGYANSVAASPFDDSIAALTDNSTGFVEIWHVDRGVVAHLDIPDGQGCCANVVWLGPRKGQRACVHDQNDIEALRKNEDQYVLTGPDYID
ncbi:carboxy-cis,cis-muconate cyclase [Xylaria cf. heliscus]|nr:carboxy-cis,cis-muconate cyclase [Xylaria cf. heliscus]